MSWKHRDSRTTLEGDAVGRSHSGVMSIANVMLMNSSFLLIVASAPRTLPPTSPEPRYFNPRLDHAKSPQKRALGYKPDLRLACGQRRVAVHQVAIVWNALGQEITQAFYVVAPVAL
jgi:hypothetical protein